MIKIITKDIKKLKNLLTLSLIKNWGYPTTSMIT